MNAGGVAVPLPLEQRLAQLQELDIDEKLALGLDIGIGSCGIAVVECGAKPKIVFMGSRCFDPPENPKTNELLNKARRQQRGQRRVIRRRRQRMHAVRRLLHTARLLESPFPVTPAMQKGICGSASPWTWRAEGLTRRLERHEFAAALIHIARHRGFKSNSKRDRANNAPDETKKMLASISKLEEKAARYTTFGEMLARDEAFRNRKRNLAGLYDCTPKRDLIVDEVRKLFEAQRRLGNDLASKDLEEQFGKVAFHQRPLQDSEHMVGNCLFEPSEKRAARNGYSFELFRFLARLTTLRIVEGGSIRRLSPQELNLAVADFGTQRSITYKALRRKIGLGEDALFEGVSRASGADGAKRGKKSVDGEARDVAASKGAAAGTYAIREAIGDASFRSLLASPEKLDRIAEVISFRDDIDRIAEGLVEIDIEPGVRDALLAAANEGKFAEFRQAGHVSALAARKMIPHFLAGAPTYDKAAEAAGYVHTTQRTVAIEQIKNPTVRRALGEAVKQVIAVLRELKVRPGRVHVELARDIGRSAEMRDEIRRGIERRAKEREEARKKFLELVARPHCTDEELQRYELWREQQERCIYSDTYIHPGWLLDGRNEVQIDHVLPRSRSQDNTRINQVLCLTTENQRKGRRTPFEWFKEDGRDWGALVARVERLPIKGIKKRNILMRSFAEREAAFLQRNLTDTRYAAKALLGALEALYGGRDTDGMRRLFARPGSITWNMRKAWAVEDLKKSQEGTRQGDKHHALDALVCACTTEAALQAVTRELQKMEQEGRSRRVVPADLPWPTFRADAIAALASVFVSRSEKRRARGEAHGATIYSVSERNGKAVVYERKSVDKLTEKDLERIKDPDRNAKLVEALREWIARGKPKADMPRSPKGDVIRKVRLATSKKSGLEVRGGYADRSTMVRVDVFEKSGRFFLVPIYLHQVADRTKYPTPPARAIVAYAEEATGWTAIDDSYSFRFSLYPDSYVEILTSKGQAIAGYYRGTDRSTGALSISNPADREDTITGIGAKTLKSFRKFQVDRLGRRTEVVREVRTWHGVVCT
jgi:CRISPR-associated endonuclease Csn1